MAPHRTYFPMNKTTFDSLPLSAEIKQAVSDMGFEQASPIQAAAIPVIAKGSDVIGQAMTGSGKTVAFSAPIIDKIDISKRHPQVLIMCPTRELAIQVAVECGKLLKHKPEIRELAVYGGQPIDRQTMALRKGVHLIIGTPGRILDHMERRTLDFSNIKCVVLDEADEMLAMGFREDIEKILDSTPTSRQTILFSATMAKSIVTLAQRYQKNPEHVKITQESVTTPQIEQFYVETGPRDRFDTLTAILDKYSPKLAVIFCNTKQRVDDVAENLHALGYSTAGIHGDMRQPKRDSVMKQFRAGIVEILVATDVAARGIDVEGIEIVINYDLPQDPEYYVHRIGRAGRAGRLGKSFSILGARDFYILREIERYSKSRMIKHETPTMQEMEELRIEKMLKKITPLLTEHASAEYANLVSRLQGDTYTATDIAAALLKNMLKRSKPAARKNVEGAAPTGRPQGRGGFGGSRGGSRGGSSRTNSNGFGRRS